jgi:peptidoglycan/LPS O-acetylase OafA/YrhL
MLQRIQSLYLLFVLALSVSLLFLPAYQYGISSGTDPESLDTMKAYLVTDNVLLSLLNGAVALLALVAIFLFKNRRLQIRLTGLSMLLVSILVGLLFFLADNLGTTFEQRVNYRYGAYLPIIQLVFLFLAHRNIRKDEELVRSADRLR